MEECQAAFRELKRLLVDSMVMVHWDGKKDTRLYVDHGPAGLGATVAQNHAKEGESRQLEGSALQQQVPDST